MELRAELNGSVEDAITELRTIHPDVHYVEHLLSPRLSIRLPGYLYSRQIDVIEDKISFNCGSSATFLKFIVGYCEAMDLKYIIV